MSPIVIETHRALDVKTIVFAKFRPGNKVDKGGFETREFPLSE